MSGINLVLFEPKADWKPQLKFPALTGVKNFSLDVETKDPLLRERGPGSIRGDGKPVGISLYTDTGFGEYYPFDHQLGGNLPKEHVVAFFTDLCKRNDLGMVGANIIYDLEWLYFLGIDVKCHVGDIQLAEPLLDEESIKGYSLNVLAEKYLGIKKDEDLLKKAASAYGVDPKFGLWQLHSKYTGPYAKMDAELAFKIHQKQGVEIHRQNLTALYNLECDLVEIVLKMRLQGVRVDLEEASNLAKELKAEETRDHNILCREVGFTINVNSAEHIARVCGMRDLPVPRTEKGNPSFDKVFLKNADDKFFQQVLRIRTLGKLRKDFVEGIVIKHSINGRIHAQFHQLRDDDGGTRSGRFSSSNPNLQQIPSRDKIIAPKIRRLFRPNDGEKWAKLDYSKQEPRLLVHYAYLLGFEGAAAMREAFIKTRKVDPYEFIRKSANIPYDHAKIISLGIMYGEGEEKLAKDLGLSRAKARELITDFNKLVPFVKKMADKCMQRANEKGVITTLLGRRQRFDFWEPPWNCNERDRTPRRLEDAQRVWQGKWRLSRAYAYKALNRLIQGSAADMTKAAMVQIYRETKHVPLLQVHDELDFSLDNEQQGKDIQHHMEHCVDMTVPIVAELSMGDHWK